VVFVPRAEEVTVDLSDAPVTLAVSWLDTATGAMHDAGTVQGGATRAFAPPPGSAQVLYLH
jgi:hypothetical protein